MLNDPKVITEDFYQSPRGWKRARRVLRRIRCFFKGHAWRECSLFPLHTVCDPCGKTNPPLRVLLEQLRLGWWEQRCFRCRKIYLRKRADENHAAACPECAAELAEIFGAMYGPGQMYGGEDSIHSRMLTQALKGEWPDSDFP